MWWIVAFRAGVSCTHTLLAAVSPEPRFSNGHRPRIAVEAVLGRAPGVSEEFSGDRCCIGQTRQDLAALAKDAGQICGTEQVIGTGRAATLEKTRHAQTPKA